MELLVAGFLHDYNHSGGRLDDRTNVLAANAAWHTMHKHPMLREVDFEIVQGLILITEFRQGQFTYRPEEIAPSMKNGENVVFMAQCLRDADLMTIYSDNAAEHLLGLFTEINRSLELADKAQLSLDEFVRGNRAFLEGAEMFTAYGKTIKDRYLESCLAKFEYQMAELQKRTSAVATLAD